jgi:hypothetical protein
MGQVLTQKDSGPLLADIFSTFRASIISKIPKINMLILSEMETADVPTLTRLLGMVQVGSRVMLR